MTRDFWIHIGAQVAMAAGAAIVATLAHANYAQLGVAAPIAQAAAAVLAETWNQYFPVKAS